MRSLLLLLALTAFAAAQDAMPLDTSYLKDHAQTRGFMLGRPVRPRVTPDGKAVLFLRANPRQAKMSLFEMDTAPGKANVRVRRGAVPVDGGETVWLDWDREKYPYLGRVDWQKGGLTLLVQD